MNYLPSVQNPKLAEKLLKEQLPGCKVEFVEGKAPDNETKGL